MTKKNTLGNFRCGMASRGRAQTVELKFCLDLDRDLVCEYPKSLWYFLLTDGAISARAAVRLSISPDMDQRRLLRMIGKENSARIIAPHLKRIIVWIVL